MEKLRVAMAALQRENGPIRWVFVEQQHLAGSGNLNSLKKLIALNAMAEWVSFSIGAQIREVNILQWRQHFLGKAPQRIKNGRKVSTWDRATAKAAALRVCALYGWDVADSDDAAEAAGILDFACSLLPDHVRPWRDRLLMRGG